MNSPSRPTHPGTVPSSSRASGLSPVTPVATLPPSPVLSHLHLNNSHSGVHSPEQKPTATPPNNNNNDDDATTAAQSLKTRPHSESDAETMRVRQEYKRYFDDLLEWTSSQENLDVYQLQAFYTATHEVLYYWRNIWKMICVQFIQSAGLVILLYYDYVEDALELTGDAEQEEGKGACYTKSELNLKLLAFALTSFLSLRLSDQVSSLAEYGMYSWGAEIKNPHFINWGWIAYGLTVNYITLISSFVISCLVVYNSETPLDMILNFVALYFIIDLDDEMVNFANFQDIQSWLIGDDDDAMDEEQGGGVASIDSPYDQWVYNVAVGNDKGLSAGVVDEDDDGYDDVSCAGRCGSCWNACGVQCMKRMSKCRDPKIARTLMAPLVILAPIFVLVCY
mmetsp:Transcript_9436/g.14457  ORF Transcript_9436/g.14457 Transcript_9436/m.14457 type:complete len:394 (-) Transcript_9436:128-1309(-)|eukprot:CAMPEP_0202720764 /NCGR_PEP_ID=MMETSP1385-20130828/143118_1 /ASSEMBLY_ACC=CAM_ASM_000861 /TAXON_ID=933848 /ORGANISM="Elphidium margaritaceum" /LENGTH=393 /DNA_ID=CAMNT_0049384671 /DNA_START=87 /DNA_END=1268 /DNA_ORIENTATION=-